MIGFGELRRTSQSWGIDIAAVERVYALDWLLAGFFSRNSLQQAFSLRGETALGKAYFSDFPPVQEGDLVCENPLDTPLLEGELIGAAVEATRSSGLRFRLDSIRGTEARFEFTGPLGRRSAAQPHLPLRFHMSALNLDPVRTRLIHPFSDNCEAIVRAVSLEETAARLLSGLSGKPRVRDVFDLWFILDHGEKALNEAEMVRLARDFAIEKGLTLRSDIEHGHRLALARAWDQALGHVANKPTFEQVQDEIKQRLKVADA